MLKYDTVRKYPGWLGTSGSTEEGGALDGNICSKNVSDLRRLGDGETDAKELSGKGIALAAGDLIVRD